MVVRTSAGAAVERLQVAAPKRRVAQSEPELDARRDVLQSNHLRSAHTTSATAQPNRAHTRTDSRCSRPRWVRGVAKPHVHNRVPRVHRTNRAARGRAVARRDCGDFWAV
jgi:hypothetical protein